MSQKQTASDFLNETSPNDNAGVREHLLANGMYGVVCNIMNKYAQFKLSEKDKEIEELKDKLQNNVLQHQVLIQELNTVESQINELVDALEINRKVGVGQSTDFYLQAQFNRKANELIQKYKGNGK